VVAVVAAVVGLSLITKKEEPPEAHVPFVLLVFLLPWFLKFQPNLAGKRPIPGRLVIWPNGEVELMFRFGAPGVGWFEDIFRVEAELQIPGFPDPHPLLKICIEIPDARAVDRVQSQ
jgi:hypothetical protein